MMRRWTTWALVAAAYLAPDAVGQGPVTPTREAAANATDGELDRILAAWDAQLAGFETMRIVFERVDKSRKWGDQVFQGKVLLKSPDLACLELKKAILGPDGKPQYVKAATDNEQLVVEREPFERLVWTGKEVVQYEWDLKEVFVYPFDRASRQTLVFRLFFDWSLPFASSMKAAEARRRYEMKLLKQDEKSYTIEIVPREEIDRKRFRIAYVILSKSNFLPSRLTLLPVGDKERQDFTFREFRPNEEIDDGYFQRRTMPGWKVGRNAGETTLPGFGWWARFLELNRPSVAGAK